MIGAFIGPRSLGDNSFFTHLATGRYILENGFPTSDVYSFTAPGERWVVQSWLVSFVYGALDRVVGLVGIRAFSAVLAGTVAGIMWTLTRPAKGLVARLAICVVGLTLGATIWAPRPLMVGLVLLGVTLLAAERRIPAPVLVPVFWLWVNSHGSFPLGLVALGCFALGSRLDGERRPSELRPLMWAAIGTVLGAINPLGPVLLTFPVSLLEAAGLAQRRRRVAEPLVRADLRPGLPAFWCCSPSRRWSVGRRGGRRCRSRCSSPPASSPPGTCPSLLWC